MSFSTAVETIYANWMALRMLIANSAGGSDSEAIGRWMIQATVQWFNENKNLEVDEVEDFLADVIEDSFNGVSVEDGSYKEIAALLVNMFNVCGSGNGALIRAELDKLPRSSTRLDECQREEQESDEDASSDEEDTMDVDEKAPSKSEPIVDEDGFTLVTRKKK